ncbi:unnamed protein product, partial [Vitis vinifera]
MHWDVNHALEFTYVMLIYYKKTSHLWILYERSCRFNIVLFSIHKDQDQSSNRHWIKKNMATPNSTPIDSSSGDEAAAKAMHKRYEGLVTVRTKAIKGKGAWYWAHLEPILVPNPDTGLPKAVKLKCSLCEAVFSASNPSRTASEHLKRGTCPNFSSALRPISTVSPSLALPPSHNHRKRSAHMGAPSSSYHVSSLAMVLSHHQLVLSGGKEDLGALAMLEDSVKRLKSPKASPGPELSKEQINSALELLADWFYESCGSVSFSSLEHPKFQAFLNQVGLPSVSRREFSGARLDTKFDEAKIESEARIRDAMFFQVASDGWNSKNFAHGLVSSFFILSLMCGIVILFL